MEKNRIIIFRIIWVCLCCLGINSLKGKTIALQPVSFEQVYLEEFFWYFQSENQLKHTLPAVWEKFKTDGLWMKRQHPSVLNDVDFYRNIENMAYINFFKKDSVLALKLDSAAALVEHHFSRNIKEGLILKKSQNQSSEWASRAAFYRTAVAHRRATGERRLLDLAERDADYVARKFQEAESFPTPQEAPEWGIALCDLYRLTGKVQYRDMAASWIQTLSSVTLNNDTADAYVYAAMTDVAALTGDTLLLQQIHRHWIELIRRDMRITGGFVSDSSFQKTIAALEWSFRLYLATSDVRCFDVCERIWYNELRSGISVDGMRFARSVKLSSDATAVARDTVSHAFSDAILISTAFSKFANMIYATDGERDVYLTQYVRGAVTIKTDSLQMKLDVMGSMPWAGGFYFTIQTSDKKPQFARFHIRVPDWLGNQFLPGIGGYSYLAIEKPRCRLYVNGIERKIKVKNGYITLEGEWKDGDRINYLFPTPTRRIFRNGDEGCQFVFQRGPFVFCFESPELADGTFKQKVIYPEHVVSTRFVGSFLTGVQIITGNFVNPDSEESVNSNTVDAHSLDNKEGMPFLAFPYYAWGNRPGAEMRVWMPCRHEN